MSFCLRISYPEGGTAAPPQVSIEKDGSTNPDWPPFFRIPTVRRQIIIFPFEVAMALWCAYSGITGALHVGPAADAFHRALGPWATLFNIWFVIAGLSMYLGVALTRRNIEAFGLILVISSLVIRITALIWAVGTDSSLVNQYVLNGLITLAALARLLSLWRHYYVIEITAKK